MKRSIIIAFAATAFSLWADEWNRSRWGGSIGLQGGFFTSYGAVAEVDYRDAYAIQLDYYRYSEFQGIFPRDENLPYQQYHSRGIDIGYYGRFGHLKFGVFTGAEYVTGMIRGEFLRSDSTYSLSFGGEGEPHGLNRYYEEVRLDDVLIPFKLSAGIAWQNVEFDIVPRFYYHQGEAFFNIPLSVRFGYL